VYIIKEKSWNSTEGRWDHSKTKSGVTLKIKYRGKHRTWEVVDAETLAGKAHPSTKRWKWKKENGSRKKYQDNPIPLRSSFICI